MIKAPTMETHGGTLLSPIKLVADSHVLCDCVTSKNGVIQTQVAIADIINFDASKLPEPDEVVAKPKDRVVVPAKKHTRIRSNARSTKPLSASTIDTEIKSQTTQENLSLELKAEELNG